MKRIIRISLMSLIFTVGTVSAHHSVSYHFDADSPSSINGVVKQFRLRNPHTEMQVDVTNTDGSITTWRVEMTSRATLEKQGWTISQFRPGQQIKIDGFSARREENAIYLREAYVDNEPVTSFNYGKLAIPSEPDPSQEVDTSVVGTWVRAIEPTDPSRSGQPLEPNAVNPYSENLTEAGLAASQAYRADVDDPGLKCQAASIVRVWGQPDFSPTVISREGDILTIQHEVFDLKRTVYLNQDHPDDISPSMLGHSIGRFEEDELIIDTYGFKPGVLLTHPGVLHTDQLRVIERFNVNQDTGVMTMEWTATDPNYFAKPQTKRTYFVRSNIPLGKFDCMTD
ncbi:DUF6152 family protein [Arenicella sp.]|nr:DUF6152 family protein [Arenicella sp.]